MIRCASLAALCAFGLSNVAQASVAMTTADTTGMTANVTTLTNGAGTLQFSTTPVLSGSNGVSLSGGEQAITSIGGDSGSVPLGSSGGSATITDLTLNANTGALFGRVTGGGDIQVKPGTIEVTTPLIVSGGGPGSGSTITVSPPAPLVNVQPIEPPPGGWITPPFFPTPAPTYPQQAGMACSGAFSVSFGAHTTVNCQADLWFTNGYFAANQSIVANALGNILVDDVSFIAPLIQFNAGANFVTSMNPIWLDGNTTIQALGVNIAGPLQTTGTSSLNINSQTINLNPAIPEPSTWAMMGLGLVGLSLAARRKA
jgi:hypothetical protein